MLHGYNVSRLKRTYSNGPRYSNSIRCNAVCPKLGDIYERSLNESGWDWSDFDHYSNWKIVSESVIVSEIFSEGLLIYKHFEQKINDYIELNCRNR